MLTLNAKLSHMGAQCRTGSSVLVFEALLGRVCWCFRVSVQLLVLNAAPVRDAPPQPVACPHGAATSHAMMFRLSPSHEGCCGHCCCWHARN